MDERVVKQDTLVDLRVQDQDLREPMHRLQVTPTPTHPRPSSENKTSNKKSQSQIGAGKVGGKSRTTKDQPCTTTGVPGLQTSEHPTRYSKDGTPIHLKTPVVQTVLHRRSLNPYFDQRHKTHPPVLPRWAVPLRPGNGPIPSGSTVTDLSVPGTSQGEGSEGGPGRTRDRFRLGHG